VQAVRPQVCIEPQVKFAGQSALEVHGLPEQWCVASQAEPVGHWLSAVHPGTHSALAGPHTHSRVSQMYVGPMDAQSVSEPHGCIGIWQMPHPEEPPGGTQV
jgi:hypothetical protein